MTDLPALPQVLVELVETCHRVDVTYDELARCVGKDPALAAMALNFMGSTAGGQRRPGGLPSVLERLGRETLRAIAVQCAARTVAPTQPDAEVLVDFWRRGLRCAAASRALALRVKEELADEAYLAGLLHNIGQWVLHARYPVKYAHLLRSTGDAAQQLSLESEQFGVDHAELGAQLVRQWRATAVLADAIRYHRQPDEYLLDAHPLVGIVHLAQRLARCDAAPDPALIDAAQRLFGIDSDTLSGLLAEVNRVVGRLGESLHLHDDSSIGFDPYRLPDSDGALARRIREFTLLGGVRARLASGAEAEVLLGAVLQGARILAGVRPAVCFRADADGVLHGCDPFSERPEWTEFAIRRDSRSVLAKALAQGDLVHSFDLDAPALSVVDRQIIERLGTDGMVCLPLRTANARVGVLVLGVDQGRHSEVLGRSELLLGYAGEATLDILAALVARDEAPSSAPDEGRIRRIVHEVNNPLSIIRNYLKVLNLKLGSGHPAETELRIIEEELIRAGQLLEGLSDRAEPTEVRREPVALNSLVRDLARLSQESFLAGLTVDLDLDESLPPLVSNADALKQVLINLMRNAAEAMDGAGRLTLRTRDWHRVDGAPFVELEVADTGPGLPESVRKNLYQAVKTEKAGHAGLGLSIVKQLVDSLGGSIGHRTGESAGTTFRILLPREVAERRSSDRATDPKTTRTS